MTIDDLITALQQLDASLGTGGDVLNTPDAQARFWSEKRAIAAAITGLRNGPADLEKPTRLCAEWEAKHKRVIDAQAEIERLIESQPDWREIRDRATRDREWGRQQDLLASRRALTHGVEYFAGVPAVPNALKSLLGVTVDFEGRHVPNWYGTVDDIAGQVAKWRSRRDAAQSALASHVATAEALLKTEPVTS
jgi:hypothetical protein